MMEEKQIELDEVLRDTLLQMIAEQRGLDINAEYLENVPLVVWSLAMTKTLGEINAEFLKPIEGQEEDADVVFQLLVKLGASTLGLLEIVSNYVNEEVLEPSDKLWQTLEK